MEIAKDAPDSNIIYDPQGVDPLGTAGNNVIDKENGHGKSTVENAPTDAGDFDDFESQIDSLSVNSTVKSISQIIAEKAASQVDSSAGNNSVKSKGKRVYRKRRQIPKDDSTSDDSSDDIDPKRSKLDTDDISTKSNCTEESEGTLDSNPRSRRSNRKSRPNNFYTNFELESGSGSDKEKTSYKGVKLPDDEYTPVKEKKGRQPKITTGKKVKRKLSDPPESQLEPPSEPPTAMVVSDNITDPVSSFSNENTPASIPAANSTKDPLATLTTSETLVEPSNDDQVQDTPTLSQNPDISNPVSSNSSLTDIKITSVSSMATKTPNTNPNMFKETQMNSACSFIKDALKTTAELGNLLNSKANEFVEKKTTTDFMTDTRRLQFCMEKAFILFNLARNNLSGIEKKLKKDFAEFMVTNKYDKLLKRDKNTNAFLSKHNITLGSLEVKSCPEPQVDSDSDCEIIEEECTQPVPSPRKLPVELDILRRVEKNGISWKANTGGSISSDSDGGQRIKLPGKNAVWINKDIQVKKVTPQKNYNRSFFREDGRTLKPPDIKGTLASTKQVDKTALILGWLDLAYKQASDNFFSIIKKMEKRNDSCSDLGESCSDDEVDNLPIFLQNYAFDKNHNNSLSNDPNSLMKMCLNKINETFLSSCVYSTKSLEKKFNFHLFDDFEYDLPNDHRTVLETKCLSPHKDNVNLLPKGTTVVDLNNTSCDNLPSSENRKDNTFSVDESSRIMENRVSLDVKNACADVDTAIKLEKALKDLLKSSTESDDGASEAKIQRKKRFTKRIKRSSSGHKYSSENRNPSVSSELSKLTDRSEIPEDFSEYNHLKTDPKLKYQSFVKIHPLSAELLKPFEDYLKELEQDMEIERLIDLSTLIRHRNYETTANDVNVKKTEKLCRRKKQTDKTPAENDLLNFVTSEDISSGIVKDSTLCKAEAKEEETEQPIEQLALKFQKQRNSLAKDLLAGSSSNESSDEVSLTSNNCASEKKKSKATRDDDTNETKIVLSTKGKSKDESNEKMEEVELKTPQKKPESARRKQKPDFLLGEISRMMRDAPKQNKKCKNDSGDEESRWLKKKSRMLSDEKRKIIKSGTDDDSDDSGTSFNSADSQLLQTSADSLLTNIKSNHDLSSLQSSPFTPKTKNILAQSDLLSDSSEDSASTVTHSPAKLVTSSMVILETPSKGRKNIRRMINDDFLMDTTKLAAKEEEDRLQRLSEKNSQLTELISQLSPKKNESGTGPSLVLDFDVETKMSLVAVHPGLVKILKAHQYDGVKFMWDTCFESVQMVNDGKPGGGCILAHCMGLGKSLQVVALAHTVLTSDLLSMRTVLICCPLSTVLNWADEFQKWLKKAGCANSVKVFELSKFKKNYERGFHLEDWHKTGGVFIIGYEMFRLLTTLKEAPKVKPHVLKKIYTTLLNPGPDIVVCDEGHLLKNDNTALAKVMNKIRTRRRIVLTGTPLQNNLKEYYCMVNFVKPNLLGSRREYFNRFENPISNGQHRDSSLHDIKIMKKRSHVLHKMLEGCVQRKEANILYKYLPRKLEYVLLTTLSECQVKIYRHYLERFARSNSSKGASLLKDFHILQKIWTHPRTLQQFLIKSREKKLNKEKGKKNSMFYQKKMINGGFVCLEDDGIVAEETLAEPDDSDWWTSYVNSEALEDLKTSPKFSIAFDLLDESLQAGDKMLIFCTSLFTLDTMEYFLRKNKDWKLGHDYYRLDGSVSLENRQNWCRQFNSDRNREVKLFLISTRAGGLGINMIAANRVIIMDVSWNPSHDVQSIFRVYRFGQKKDCFIYRLVALGTMEEKMYERSVTKQAVSCRVVDEQQIDRHYNMADLSELYWFNPIPSGPQPVPSFPSDHVLATVLANSGQGNKNHPSVDSHLVEVSEHVNNSLSGETHQKCQDKENQSTTHLVNKNLNADNDLVSENLPDKVDNENCLVSDKTCTENSTNTAVSGSTISSHIGTVRDSDPPVGNGFVEDCPTTATNDCNVSNGPLNDCLPFVWSMHEHDSLLRDLHEEQLDEDDRRTAWLEYEAEREQNRQAVKSNAEVGQAVKSNAEVTLPHLKRPNIKHFRLNFPVFTGNFTNFREIFPEKKNTGFGQIFPNQSRILPMYNNSALGTHKEMSILPDLDNNNVLNPILLKKCYNPIAPQRPYLAGRYGPIRSERLKSKSTVNANDAFKNIQISNITGFSSAISNNENHRRRKRKALSYFPSGNVSASTSSVLDLTALPDTPDKEKPSDRNKGSSGKKSKKRTPGKTPKRISARSYRNSPSKNKKHRLTKKLSFGNDNNDVAPSQGASHDSESTLPDNPKETTAMITIELE